MNRKKIIEPVGEKCCTPRASTTEIEKKQRVHDYKTAWIKEQWKMQGADPRIEGDILLPTPGFLSGEWILGIQGVEIFLNGFPDGTVFHHLQNFNSIIRAFSRMLGPNLFAELGMSDPFPWQGPYWNKFFFELPGGLRLGIDNLNIVGTCLGVTGQYQSPGIMSIYDCTDEPSIFHEIGHAVMDDGILKARKPMFFQYFTGNAPNGEPEIYDSRKILLQYFGKLNLDERMDSDNVLFGFVSSYAMKSQKEDFAETFMHYVYYPELMWEKIERQQSMGSNILSIKAGLISALYCGLWFKEYGVPGGWPGYPL